LQNCFVARVYGKRTNLIGVPRHGPRVGDVLTQRGGMRRQVNLAVTLRRTAAPQVIGGLLNLGGQRIPGPYNRFSPPRARTEAPLDQGDKYLVSVQGTASKWAKSHWQNSGWCGDSDPAPMFTTGQTGPVGIDPEWTFASPRDSEYPHRCNRIGLNGASFQIDDGTGFADRTPIFMATQSSAGQLYPVPNPDHEYVYEVTGHGKPLRFRFVDNHYDNYGAFKITVARKPT
jgi:hypothetical protein